MPDTNMPQAASLLARDNDPLLQPLQIRHVRFKNRVFSTGHASSHDEGGMPREKYQRYHEEKAKGGLALTTFGGSSMVGKDSSWGGGQINVSTDEIIPHLRQFAARIHAHGAAIMCQISHLGRRATSASTNWLPTVGPSALRERRHRDMPREMDRGDIDRIVAEYAEAAWRCKEGGLDGVETVTGGHLIGQFMSPRTNQRTDGFGGSLANRARFGIMVHEAMRRRVGDAFLVGIRYGIDEGTEGGFDLDEGIRLAQLMEAEGTLDFFNANFGRMDTDLALAEHNMPGMSQPLGAVPAIGRHVQTRGAAAGDARRPHPGRDQRPLRRGGRPGGHGGHDPRPHGGPADRQQDHAWRGGADPALRRRVLLHVQEDLLHP